MERLRTVAFLRGEEIRALPAARRPALLRAEPLSWDELATPRDVIKRLADQRGLSVVNLDQVPHDLWPAGLQHRREGNVIHVFPAPPQ